MRSSVERPRCKSGNLNSAVKGTWSFPEGQAVLTACPTGFRLLNRLGFSIDLLNGAWMYLRTCVHFRKTVVNVSFLCGEYIRCRIAALSRVCKVFLPHALSFSDLNGVCARSKWLVVYAVCPCVWCQRICASRGEFMFQETLYITSQNYHGHLTECNMQ